MFYLICVFLPLIAALVVFFCKNFLPKKWCSNIPVYAVGVSFSIASVSLFFLNKFFYYTWYWIPSADFGITLYLLFSMKFLWRYVILLLPPAVLFPYIDFHWFIGIRKTPINEVIDIGTWFSIGTFGVNITFLFDTLSIIMLFVITSYHFLFIYTLEYMS
jgi:NADH:ubiquinone oxidoreductase subunit 5 (subunit L)/multisubunit Na+/H+ antiporter MnhA subunit